MHTRTFKKRIKESLTPEEDTLRKKLHHIVTRGGMSARIPDMLDLELNKLERLYEAQRQADIQRISYMFAIPVKDIEKVLESKEIV